MEFGILFPERPQLFWRSIGAEAIFLFPGHFEQSFKEARDGNCLLGSELFTSTLA